MTRPLALDVGGPVSDGLRTVTTFVPKLIGAALLLVVGWFVAKVVAKVVDRLLHRVGFDGALERGGIKRALSSTSLDAGDLVSKLVFFAVFLPFLSAAVGALGIAALTQPLAAFIALVPRILVAIVLVVVGAVLAGAVRGVVQQSLGGLSYGKVVGDVAGGLVLLGFVKAALDQVGVATTVTGPLLYAILGTVAGVVVVGVGGGLVRPMQSRWESMLDSAAIESGKIKAAASAPRPAAPAPAAPAPSAAAPAPASAAERDVRPAETAPVVPATTQRPEPPVAAAASPAGDVVEPADPDRSPFARPAQPPPGERLFSRPADPRTRTTEPDDDEDGEQTTRQLPRP